MVGDMRPPIHEFEVVDSVVATVAVAVVNVRTGRDWPVMMLPHRTMKSATLALIIEPAEVIPDAKELLGRRPEHNWRPCKSLA